MSNVMAALAGTANLPVAGTRSSPKKFKGQYYTVKPFLRHYERLCLKHQITDEKDKCENILQYCSREAKDCIKGLPGYEQRQWSDLVNEIKDIFDADRDEKKYKLKNLTRYSEKYREKKINTLAKWKEYVRGFTAIETYLKGKKNISQETINTTFWVGIPRHLRRRLEQQLKIDIPKHNMEEPFAKDKINAAATKILHRSRFDAAYETDSDEESLSESSDGSWDGDDSESSSDEDDWFKSPKHKNKSVRFKRKPKILSKKHSQQKLDSETEDENHIRPTLSPKMARATLRELDKEEDKASKQDEVEIIIQRLSNMSLNDPTYGLLYYRALKLDADVVKVLKAPVIRTDSQVMQSRPRTPDAFRRDELQCFGCGKTGHGMSSCSTIDKLVQKEVIRKDNEGRLVMKDGSKIVRNRNESFLKAIERQLGPQANIVVFQESNSESDSDDLYVFNVERRLHSIKQKTNEANESQYPTPSTSKSKGKGKAPVNNPEPTRASPRRLAPVDTQRPVHDTADDDAIIEDLTQASQANKTPANPPAIDKKKAVPRKSTVSSHVNPHDVMLKILNTPITLAVGEVVGASKEVSGLLQEVLKYKAQKSDTPIVSLVNNTSRGTLIRLNIECDNRVISAIVDTGSELNIIRKDVWKQIGIPMDIRKQCTIHDANGGEGILHGLVENVSLKCGGVQTLANVYVGDNIPFELLLGRPWQRDNRIGIEERSDGTYLIFKDMKDQDSQFEMLATPAEEIKTRGYTSIPSFMVITSDKGKGKDKQDRQETMSSSPTSKTKYSEYYPNAFPPELIYNQSPPSSQQYPGHSNSQNLDPQTLSLISQISKLSLSQQSRSLEGSSEMVLKPSEPYTAILFHDQDQSDPVFSQQISGSILETDRAWPGESSSYSIWTSAQKSQENTIDWSNSQQIIKSFTKYDEITDLLNAHSDPVNSLFYAQSASLPHYSANLPTKAVKYSNY